MSKNKNRYAPVIGYTATDQSDSVFLPLIDKDDPIPSEVEAEFTGGRGEDDE